MSLDKIRSAFASTFKDGGFYTTAQIAWENVVYTPPATGNWARFTFLPNNPDIASIGAGGRSSQTGLVQIDLNFPIGGGDGEAMTKYLAVKNAFTEGSRLIYQGQEISIRSCGRSQGRVIDNFYRVSVSIYFYAQINR